MNRRTIVMGVQPLASVLAILPSARRNWVMSVARAGLPDEQEASGDLWRPGGGAERPRSTLAPPYPPASIKFKIYACSIDNVSPRHRAAPKFDMPSLES